MNNITLGELLAHPDQNVRRHATGALKALEKYQAKIIAAQDARIEISPPLLCSKCGRRAEIVTWEKGHAVPYCYCHRYE